MEIGSKFCIFFKCGKSQKAVEITHVSTVFFVNFILNLLKSVERIKLFFMKNVPILPISKPKKKIFKNANS